MTDTKTDQPTNTASTEAGIIDKKCLEFTIEDENEQWDFIAIRVGERSDESGWYNLYAFDEEGIQMTMIVTLGPDDTSADIVKEAKDWVSENWDINTEHLSLQIEGVQELEVENER